ncbi:MAG: YlxR family protein [Actinomycetota bacterium]
MAARPVRTCVGCRRKAPQGELVRVALGPDGLLSISRTLPGRGAWLCAGSLQCLRLAARRNALSRALRAPVSADAVAALEPDLSA